METKECSHDQGEPLGCPQLVLRAPRNTGAGHGQRHSFIRSANHGAPTSKLKPSTSLSEMGDHDDDMTTVHKVDLILLLEK